MTAAPDYSRVDPGIAFTLIYIARTIKRYWWFILMVTTLMVGTALYFYLNTTPVYRASVTAYPASSVAGPGSSLRGLASQLGLSADPSQMSLAPSVDETLAVLQSRDMTESFIRRHYLIPAIFVDEWDAPRHAWKPESAVARWLRQIRGELQNPDGPSEAEAVLAFERIRHVTDNSVTGIITVSIDYRDPVLAAKWANDLVEETDATLRDRALKESQLGLAYLQQQAANASLSDLRGAIYQVASGEITKSMLAKVRSNFAVKILDRATPPLRPVWPRFVILVGLALVGGLFFSTAVALVVNYVRELRTIARLVVRPELPVADGHRSRTPESISQRPPASMSA